MLEVLVAKRVGTLELALELSVGAETLLVAGPNGAGKSTLLRLLLGVARSFGRHRDDGAIEQFVSPGLLVSPGQIFIHCHPCFR